jgi:CelD/BcsL family acetyltransferase involved in cellulose biosynthesis
MSGMAEAETKLETKLLDLWDERWVNLTEAHPKAHIFHHPAWTSLLANCYGYRPFVVALCDADGNIRAGIPMMEVAHFLRGRRYIALPFTDHCAPLHYSDEAQSCLINGLIQLSKDQHIPEIELRFEFPPHPSIQSNSQQVLHTLPLYPDSESVASRFHSTHRRNIGVALKRGVRVEWGTKREHLEAFYRLHLQTRRRQGIPVQPWRFFDLLASDLIERGLGFVLLAFKDDECLAAAVFLHWQRTLTYKYGASAVNGLNLRPNNLLFWTAIHWGCENGYAVFDMGKTDLANTGLREFKSGWGCEEQILNYSYMADRPLKTSAFIKAYPLLTRLIQRSPAWVCRAMGELLYQYFG